MIRPSIQYSHRPINLLGKNHPAVFPVTMIIAVLFILASTFVFMKRIHRDKAEPNE